MITCGGTEAQCCRLVTMASVGLASPVFHQHVYCPHLDHFKPIADTHKDIIIKNLIYGCI